MKKGSSEREKNEMIAAASNKNLIFFTAGATSSSSVRPFAGPGQIANHTSSQAPSAMVPAIFAGEIFGSGTADLP